MLQQIAMNWNFNGTLPLRPSPLKPRERDYHTSSIHLTVIGPIFLLVCPSSCPNPIKRFSPTTISSSADPLAHSSTLNSQLRPFKNHR